MTTLIKDKNKIILFILSILWTLFIFSMSIKSAEDSSALSSGLLKKILEYVRFDGDFDFLHNLIRKLAHFTEYFILGIFTVNYVKTIKSRPVYALIYCLFIGIFDEFLQFYNGMGRSMQVTDMLIDFFGSLFASIIIYIIMYTKRKKRA